MEPKAGRWRVWRLGMTALAMAWSTASACDEAAIDGVLWACASDAECGGGATCRAGVCALAHANPAGGLSCETAGDRAARFAIEVDAGRRKLVFERGGSRGSFELPDEVVGLEEGPVTACCEEACCRE